MKSEYLESPTPKTIADAEGLPIGKLLAFTMAGFLAIMTETMPAGLLPQIGQGWAYPAPRGSAGDALRTGFRPGGHSDCSRHSHLEPQTAIPAGARRTAGVQHPHRLVQSLRPDPGARFVAGMAAGVVWGLLAGYARRMVPTHLQGRALAVVGVGQPIALAIGVPLGTWLGTWSDWRGVFWIMSALSLLLFLWVWLSVPGFAGQSAGQRVPIRHIFRMPGIRPVLLALFVWILAHNILYTYIAPFLASVGLGEWVDAMPAAVWRRASIVGIWLTGLLVDRLLRTADAAEPGRIHHSRVDAWLLLFIAMGRAARHHAVGADLWRCADPVADRALGWGGRRGRRAQSMLVTMFNLAVVGGTGWHAAGTPGRGILSWTMAALALLGLSIVWSSRQHAWLQAGPPVPAQP